MFPCKKNANDCNLNAEFSYNDRNPKTKISQGLKNCCIHLKNNIYLCQYLKSHLYIIEELYGL